MLLLEPVSIEKIWGTPRLHKYGGNKNINLIGSVYSASATKEITTNIIYDRDDHFNNMTFYDAIKQSPMSFGLDRYSTEFPLIISFTGADKDLSIQVHPTDEFAKEIESKQTGKSESWYFIEAPTTGSIYAEAKINNKQIIKKGIKNQKIDDIIKKQSVNKGDLVYIPCGTLHALTEGSLVYEIQQSTDITYRLYDYNRLDKNGNKRETHLEKAIQTLNTKNNITITNFSNSNSSVEREYRLDNITLEKGHYKNETNIAQILTIISGCIKIDSYTINLGLSLVVFPHEIITIEDGKANIIVATPIKYNPNTNI